MKHNTLYLSLFDFFTRLLVILLLVSCEIPIDGQGKTYQGVSFALTKPDEQGISSLILSGDFSEESDFYQGDHVAVYSDDKCSQKISNDFSYDFAPQTIKLNVKVTLTDFKKYVFYIGIIKDSSLLKCLDSGIKYIKKPPIPTDFSLLETDQKNKASIRFKNLVEGISHLQFFSDEKCSEKISDKQKVDKNDVFTTNILSEGNYKIHAQFFSDDISSLCSKNHLSFESMLLPVKSVIFISKTTQNSVVRVDGMDIGDTVQLFSDASCSLNISQNITATSENIDIVVDLVIPKVYTMYAKRMDGPNNESDCSSHIVVSLLPIVKLSQISSGDFHTCVLTASGGVKCWGYGYYGQLGNGGNSQKNHPVTVKEDGSDSNLTDIVQISSGINHTCALTSSGQVKCWGKGDSGQLGNNRNGNKNRAVTVVEEDSSTTPLSGIIQISARGNHSCGLTSSSEIKCWGNNEDGQLGNDGTGNKNYPVAVVDGDGSTTALSNIIQVSVGGSRTCALLKEGLIKCWGYGWKGGLGNNGTYNNRDHPIGVADIDNAVQISSGYHHTCALTESGTVKCWGLGSDGQLGNDSTPVDKNHPVNVVDGDGSSTSLTGIIQLDPGKYHTCALTSTNNVKCWGYGSYGQLGNDGSSNKDHPVDVIDGDGSTTSLSGIVQTSAGNTNTCALTTSGNVKCWGRGTFGQLGNNRTGKKDHPVNVVDGNSLLQVGSRNIKYTCNNGKCSLDAFSLIALDLQTPITSPGSDSSPTIRVYHAQAGDMVSLHSNEDCSSTSLASGTVASDSSSIDLTTTDLTDGIENKIHAKVGEVCSSNSISYQYNSEES